MASKLNDLAIVGTGLAGTITLVHELLKIAAEPNVTPQAPVNITLVERYPQQKFGGVAYGRMAEFEEYRLNLSAKRCTPFMADNVPEGFPTFHDYIVDLANKAENKTQKERFLGYLQNPPRVLYGGYLSHLVDLALERVGNKARVTTRIAEAIDMDPSGAHPKLIVNEDGHTRTIETRQLVLATGQQQIIRPEFVESILESPLYLEDIYGAQAKGFYNKVMAEQARREKTGREPGSVLILGTALSAQDAVLRLLHIGYKGKITMVSRNGLEHIGYGSTSTDDYLKNSLVGEPRPEREAELARRPPRFMRVVAAKASAKKAHKKYPGDVEEDLVGAMEKEFAVLMRRGYTPEEVLGYWERFIPDAGDALPNSVCANIYSRYATWMAVHRVGTTPENTRLLEEAKKSGQMEVMAGFVSPQKGERPREENGKIVATIAPMERVQRAGNGSTGSAPRDWEAAIEKGQRRTTRAFDFVISGLGNSVVYDEDSRDPFWRRMVQKGLAAPHKKAEDGLDLDPNDLTLLTADGRRVENVFVAGVPAFGAAMYGRLPHPEKPGVFGGRILPFTANIVGTTGGVIAVVTALHARLMKKYGMTLEQAHKAEQSGLAITFAKSVRGKPAAETPALRKKPNPTLSR